MYNFMTNNVDGSCDDVIIRLMWPYKCSNIIYIRLNSLFQKAYTLFSTASSDFWLLIIITCTCILFHFCLGTLRWVRLSRHFWQFSVCASVCVCVRPSARICPGYILLITKDYKIIWYKCLPWWVGVSRTRLGSAAQRSRSQLRVSWKSLSGV